MFPDDRRGLRARHSKSIWRKATALATHTRSGMAMPARTARHTRQIRVTNFVVLVLIASILSISFQFSLARHRAFFIYAAYKCGPLSGSLALCRKARPPDNHVQSTHHVRSALSGSSLLRPVYGAEATPVPVHIRRLAHRRGTPMPRPQ